MSAVYAQGQMNAKIKESYAVVTAYVNANPGNSIDAIATATNVAYEVVYQILINAGMLIVPNASGEIHFNQDHGPGRR